MPIPYSLCNPMITVIGKWLRYINKASKPGDWHHVIVFGSMALSDSFSLTTTGLVEIQRPYVYVVGLDVENTYISEHDQFKRNEFGSSHNEQEDIKWHYHRQ